MINGDQTLWVQNNPVEVSILYNNKKSPENFVCWTEMKKKPFVLDVYWRGTIFMDINGDMIFDLRFAKNPEGIPEFSEGGKWRSCKLQDSKKFIDDDGENTYVFQKDQWEKLPERKEK